VEIADGPYMGIQVTRGNQTAGSEMDHSDEVKNVDLSWEDSDFLPKAGRWQGLFVGPESSGVVKIALPQSPNGLWWAHRVLRVFLPQFEAAPVGEMVYFTPSSFTTHRFANSCVVVTQEDQLSASIDFDKIKCSLEAPESKLDLEGVVKFALTFLETLFRLFNAEAVGEEQHDKFELTLVSGLQDYVNVAVASALVFAHGDGSYANFCFGQAVQMGCGQHFHGETVTNKLQWIFMECKSQTEISQAFHNAHFDCPVKPKKSQFKHTSYARSRLSRSSWGQLMFVLAFLVGIPAGLAQNSSVLQSKALVNLTIPVGFNGTVEIAPTVGPTVDWATAFHYTPPSPPSPALRSDDNNTLVLYEALVNNTDKALCPSLAWSCWLPYSYPMLGLNEERIQWELRWAKMWWGPGFIFTLFYWFFQCLGNFVGLCFSYWFWTRRSVAYVIYYMTCGKLGFKSWSAYALSRDTVTAVERGKFQARVRSVAVRKTTEGDVYEFSLENGEHTNMELIAPLSGIVKETVQTGSLYYVSDFWKTDIQVLRFDERRQAWEHFCFMAWWRYKGSPNDHLLCSQSHGWDPQYVYCLRTALLSGEKSLVFKLTDPDWMASFDYGDQVENGCLDLRVWEKDAAFMAKLGVSCVTAISPKVVNNTVVVRSFLTGNANDRLQYSSGSVESGRTGFLVRHFASTTFGSCGSPGYLTIGAASAVGMHVQGNPNALLDMYAALNYHHRIRKVVPPMAVPEASPDFLEKMRERFLEDPDSVNYIKDRSGHVLFYDKFSGTYVDGGAVDIAWGQGRIDYDDQTHHKVVADMEKTRLMHADYDQEEQQQEDNPAKYQAYLARQQQRRLDAGEMPDVGELLDDRPSAGVASRERKNMARGFGPKPLQLQSEKAEKELTLRQLHAQQSASGPVYKGRASHVERKKSGAIPWAQLVSNIPDANPTHHQIGGLNWADIPEAVPRPPSPVQFIPHPGWSCKGCQKSADRVDVDGYKEWCIHCLPGELSRRENEAKQKLVEKALEKKRASEFSAAVKAAVKEALPSKKESEKKANKQKDKKPVVCPECKKSHTTVRKDGSQTKYCAACSKKWRASQGVKETSEMKTCPACRRDVLVAGDTVCKKCILETVQSKNQSGPAQAKPSPPQPSDH
jgi:hypothetical protein